MINALQLLWIIPVSVSVGMLLTGFFTGATRNTKLYDAYQQGYLDGRKVRKGKVELPLAYTLEELFDRGFNSDFNKFKEVTGGIIYGTEKSGQLFMIFIDTVDDLSTYYDKTLLAVNDEGQYQRPIIETPIV